MGGNGSGVEELRRLAPSPKTDMRLPFGPLIACILLGACGQASKTADTSNLDIQMTACLSIEGPKSQRAFVRSYLLGLEASGKGRLREEPSWLYYRANEGAMYIHFTDRMKAFPNLIAIYGADADPLAQLSRFLSENDLAAKDCSKDYLSAITPYAID